MSVVNPPTFNTSIFNNNAFYDSNSTLTLEDADLRYLKLTGGALTGALSLNNELNVIRSSNGEAIRCNNGIVFSAIHLTSNNAHIGTTTNHSFNIQSNGNNVIQCLTNGNCNIVNSLQLNGTAITATATEINYLDITTIGVAQASKALVVDSNRDISNIRFLEINRPNNNRYFEWTDGTCQASFFINSSSVPSIGTFSNHGLGFFTNSGGSSQFFLSATSNRVGVGLNNPTFQFQVSTDSAAKPSTNTWTISSDERIKENIEDANLDICYSNIKNLKLKRYKYKDNFIENHSIEDKHKLGWIAQEVKSFIPKAVSITQNEDYDIEDFHSLNSDQIIACMYGAIQKLIEKYEQHDEFINSLEIE
jgi:hypothetical protein